MGDKHSVDRKSQDRENSDQAWAKEQAWRVGRQKEEGLATHSRVPERIQADGEGITGFMRRNPTLGSLLALLLGGIAFLVIRWIYL